MSDSDYWESIPTIREYMLSIGEDPDAKPAEPYHRSAAYYAEVRRLNQDPLNHMARVFLEKADPSWVDPGALHVLSLLRWGIFEVGLAIHSISPTHPSQEQVEDFLERLERARPGAVMSFLTTTESGDQFLGAWDLTRCRTPEAAAWCLLEGLHAMLVAVDD